MLKSHAGTRTRTHALFKQEGNCEKGGNSDVSYDYDFIGFTYNGKHSVRDLKIYRTSNSNRYEEGIIPTLKETTASVEGQVGQYYFGTKIEQKVFNISFAFDNLTDGDIREIKKTFSGDGIHDLIFDENPYKVYSAKVTGNATMKHLAFEQNGRRVYRGEGNIQLTCYYPYARSLAYTTTSGIRDEEAIEVKYGFASGKPYVAKQPKELKCGIIVDGSIETTFYIPAASGSPLVNLIWITYINESGKRQRTGYLVTADTFSTIFGQGKILIENIQYHFTDNSSTTDPTYFSSAWLSQSGTTYYYTNKGCYEGGNNGRVVNHYSIVDYPNKFAWGVECGLPLHEPTNKNVGDLPCPFIKTLSSTGSQTHKEDGMTKDLTFTLASAPGTWNSKTGLVKNADGEIVPTVGPSCHSIPVGGTMPDNSTYDFLYY